MKTDTAGLTMNQLAERNAEHVATIAALAAENAAMKSAKEIIRYVFAPIEPTSEMINAALKSHLIVFNP
ncbi:hypothetical protein ACQSFK_24445, partial [Salmonella enterica]